MLRPPLRREELPVTQRWAYRGDGIRASPHADNDEDDLDRLLVALARR